MSGHEHHIDPSPVRPSSAEGDPDEEWDDVVVDQHPGASPDLHTNHPSQAEGE